jgi:hypothetical protein
MFGGPSQWIRILCALIRHGFARRDLPDLGESRMDPQRKQIGWILFIFLWIPFCLFALLLFLRPQWLI